MEDNVIRVTGNAKASSVASVLANLIKEHSIVELRAIGAGAVNQAIKAVAIARGFTAPSGYDLVCIPAFSEADINGEAKSAITIKVINK